MVRHAILSLMVPDKEQLWTVAFVRLCTEIPVLLCAACQSLTEVTKVLCICITMSCQASGTNV